MPGRVKPPDHLNEAYLSPYKIGTRPPFAASRSGSEADSLIDLYGHPRSLADGSAANSMDKERAVPPEELYLDDEDPERSRWIHRDKLAIIESHEMQEAGIKLPPQRNRSVSKSKTRREHNQSQDTQGLPPPVPRQDIEVPSAVEAKKQRTHSPIRDEKVFEGIPFNDFDIRTPEEIAADSYIDSTSPSVYRQQDLRKSSSRIPLPRSSPMPIPQEHIERDHPLPRKRGASGNWTGEENGIAYNRIRSRQNSAASQNLLDDAEAYRTPTSASRPVSHGSPTKSRNVSNNNPQWPIIHNRKPSLTSPTATPNNQSQPLKPRQPSNSSPRTPSSTTRPKSRSGLDPARPATAINRPTEPAPWLATMYKPDPRLPPDQQLLPTHAKRLQQEQWQRAQQESEARRHLDGKASPQLPREFSPLAEHTVNGLQPSSRDRDEQDLQGGTGGGGGEWPLSVPSPHLSPSKSNTRTQSPSKANANHSPAPEGRNAGYSPMPKVRTGESPVSQQQQTQRPLDPFEKERLARAAGEGEKGEDQKKEKICGCCIVM